ncbi:umecyanin-like [Mangifera indica]|uniref:umecyanin-like n=1 Tax=Mangifera indica TaxID=29780 RepID=UPI001CFC2D05|nr:umecyanin-like [Mangifera indica]
MARISMAEVIVALVLSAAMLQVTYAEDYTVGDSTGWVRPSDSTFYTNWAADKVFHINDTLAFDFTTGAHDVAIVTKDAYDSCSTTNPTQLFQTGPVTLTLNSTGEHYYICTITGHCSAGQKLAINVVADSDNTTPGPSGSTTPPSAASSSRGFTFAFFMFVVIGLLF